VEIDRGLDPNIKFIRAPSITTHWAHGVRIGDDLTATRRPPSVPKVDRTDTPGGKAFTRQRPLIGDSLNDEQWSNHLRSHQTTIFENRRVPGEKERTWVSAWIARGTSEI